MKTVFGKYSSSVKTDVCNPKLNSEVIGNVGVPTKSEIMATLQNCNVYLHQLQMPD